MRGPPDRKAIDAVAAALRDRLPGQVETGLAARQTHGRGEGGHDAHLPDLVLFAKSTDDVALAVKACATHDVPIIPFGTGTSLEGQINAVHGGLSLNLAGLDRVLSVSGADLDCRVEAGVTREQLNVGLRGQGLFFPLDPGANATLGGMAATRASGTNAVRYGTMREVVLGLTVVTPSGEIVTTGGRARKSSSGYDLTRLYIGSEGTLGVITEVQLRLFGLPETIAAAVCPFATLKGAVETATAVLQLGIPIARIELLDDMQMRACIAYSRLEGYDEVPTLFLEFHGTPRGVAEQVEQVREIAAGFGGGMFRWADKQEDRTKLWAARHDAYWAARGLAPGKDSFATDACVPISHLAACVMEAKDAATRAELTTAVTGHVGDGNFHMLVLFDAADPAQRRRADDLAVTIARLALRYGGTISGEHGIGLHRMPLMEAEHGPALGPMRAIKAALDPRNIMNPGKMLPAPI